MEQVIGKYTYRAKFRHYRFLDWALEEDVKEALELGQIKLHAHGYCRAAASTRCALMNEDGSVAAVGYAFCSEDDNFSRKKGRNISMSRAIEWLYRLEREL